MLENIGGIPAHPLFVHLAVVAIPVAAIVFIVSIFRPATMTWWWTNVSLAVVSFFALILARSTGEGLLSAQGFSEEDPGPIADHAMYANYMTGAVIVLVACVLVAAFLPRFWKNESGAATVVRVLHVVGAIAAVAVVITAVMTGHEGAVQVWSN
ncbi:hypothetical protein PAB09_03945 [Corynebacterium sp. SCR221107]|uniref:DUF2231 domain-containing protein n=1 Tax=Corynebacterium sp. SCR221107 TaxID=3017361 RepID=UPI0022EC4145|nr:DUF2231 domain-containing protein [Corynebacterium sp. SCR221107]WBT09482.1 hypothetical protein PAB09_03945 [Corynebacterium sp. SCR221107]